MTERETKRFDGRLAFAHLTIDEQAELGRLTLEREFTIWHSRRFARSGAAYATAERALRALDDKISDLLFYGVFKRGYPGRHDDILLPSVIDEIERRVCESCGYTEIAPYADLDERWASSARCAKCEG